MPAFQKFKKYKQIISPLVLTKELYLQLKHAFAGGFTHANARWVSLAMNDLPGHCVQNVASYDFNSSYPAIMVLKKFPMTPFSPVAGDSLTVDKLKHYIKNYACLFVLEVENLVSTKWHEHPLSVSKCMNIEGYVADNGRVVTARKLATVITELDYEVLAEYYEWEKATVYDLRIAAKQYLPTPLVKAILQLYKNKTSLKGIEDMLIEYLVSKGMVNACYGMMATDPVRSVYEYINETNTFHETKDLDLDNILDKFNKNVKRFLFYAWGVWVTAYARHNLFTGITECKRDYLYSDTDSVKIINHEAHKEYFEAYNQSIIEDINAAAYYHNISVDEFMPKDKKGKARIIGLWDFEGVYDEFKSIGAKRYLVHQKTLNDHYITLDKEHHGVVVTKSDSPLYGYWELTVAGTNKYTAMKYMVLEAEKLGCTPFDLFDDGLIVPPEYSGRLAVAYIDEETEGTTVDYLGQVFSFHELSSVNFEPTNYELHMGAEFEKYLKGIWTEDFL